MLIFSDEPNDIQRKKRIPRLMNKVQGNKVGDDDLKPAKCRYGGFFG